MEFILKIRDVFGRDEGECFENSFSDPKTDFEKYTKEQNEKFNIDEDTIKGFKMQSRAYYSYAIDDIEGKKRIAVIVFESINKEALDPYKIKVELEKVLSKQLAVFIMNRSFLEPDINKTKKERF